MKNPENDRRMTPIDSTRKSPYNAAPCARCMKPVLPCNRVAAWIDVKTKITVCRTCKEEIYCERLRPVREALSRKHQQQEVEV